MATPLDYPRSEEVSKKRIDTYAQMMQVIMTIIH